MTKNKFLILFAPVILLSVWLNSSGAFVPFASAQSDSLTLTPGCENGKPYVDLRWSSVDAAPPFAVSRGNTSIATTNNYFYKDSNSSLVDNTTYRYTVASGEGSGEQVGFVVEGTVTTRSCAVNATMDVNNLRWQ